MSEVDVSTVFTDAAVAAAISSGAPTLVFFSAPWCQRCGPIKSMAEEVIAEFPGVGFVELNADTNSDTVKALVVQAVPTMLLFNRSREVSRVAVATTSPELRGLLAEALLDQTAVDMKDKTRAVECFCGELSVGASDEDLYAQGLLHMASQHGWMDASEQEVREFIAEHAYDVEVDR